jgi:hypothetical protein
MGLHFGLMPNENRNPTPEERDERVKLDIDPETALRGLLRVDPDDDPENDEDAPTEK